MHRDYDDDDDAYDKQWASKYILGPLYDPEPSQVCATRVAKALPPTPPADTPTRRFSFRRSRSNSKSQQQPEDDDDDDPEERPFLRRILSRSNSVNKGLPPSPLSPPGAPKPPTRPLSELERKRSVHTSKPPLSHWNQGTILARANSVASSRPSIDSSSPRAPIHREVFSNTTTTTSNLAARRRRGASLAERYPGDRTHRPLEMLTQDHRAKEAGPDGPDSPSLPRRGGSLRERYPGDMSHRPLDMLKRDHRAADRAPHLHTHRRQQPSDPIDSLDHTGPVPEATYHHPGPFDPTMPSRNTNKMYSPVEAVKETNLEAIKATPVEFIKDAVDRHVPLQGTAVVPPGERDMAGRVMEYREGADLMRERDAAGGAYKRWEHVPYLDEDLKGKGEPSYTVERDEKAGKGKQVVVSRKPVPGSSSGIMGYEMQPRTMTHTNKDGGNVLRHRSVSISEDVASPPPPPPKDFGYSTGNAGGDLRRSNTTGRSLAQSIKRRFGSLRRRKEEVY